MTQQVVECKSLPAFPPINWTVSWCALLVALDAPGWGWGVMWTLTGLLWLSYVARGCNQQSSTPKWEPKP